MVGAADVVRRLRTGLMRAGALVDPDEYRRQDLRAHELLADVPLHDVWSLELPGGGPDRTIQEIRSLMSTESLMAVNPVVRALFRLRGWIGRILGWDPAGAAPPDAESYLDRLSDADRAGSLVAPGSSDGPFTVLYVHRFEAVAEIRNATVHAFSVVALVPSRGGYQLFWAIYVKPVGWLTAVYMALIDPFRRFLVYPAVLGHIQRAWLDARATR